MKNVLFIGVTQYDLRREDIHLAKKFEGLSREFNVFSIARGKPLYARKWRSDFYLAPHRVLFVPVAFVIGAYLCAAKKIDVVVCQTPLTEGLMGVALSKIFRKELIVEVHGDWEEVPFLSRKRVFGGLLKKITPYVAKTSFAKADKIRTLSEHFSERIHKTAPNKKMYVFPTYTDIDYFLEENNTSFQKYILTVAVLSPVKNIEALIEAFAKVRKDFPEFKLVIAGEGPALEDLRFMIYDLGINDEVIFTGRLSAEQVREAMKDCYMFVLPSLSEGFGRVFIEAMALGKPVIGSNVGGIPEIVKDGENGFLIEPRDVEVLAQKMRELLRDELLAKSMGERGKKMCEDNFSNENYIRNFTKMIFD